jgi:phenylacetic acid degradation operon negative regulatory protein
MSTESQAIRLVAKLMTEINPFHALDKLAADLTASIDPRAKSLLVTIWGDSIFPRGGSPWLGGLIELARPFGISERLVRTSVRRLTREDWLVSTRLGRRSRYSLTESGRRRFEDARRRIHADAPKQWDGRWLTVFTGLGELGRGAREGLRRELLWLGFGAVAPNVFAHPAADRAALEHVLGDLGAADHTVVMAGVAAPWLGEARAHALLRGCWDLAGLSAAYQAFVERFGPVRAALAAAGRDGGGEGDGGEGDNGESGFVLRTLMVHEYRRILLRDPDLPEALLPADWAGAAARRLRAEIHRLGASRLERHVDSVLGVPAANP